MTTSERRLYTDEEVVLILREAAQSAGSPAGKLAPSSGLSLEQIKAAAAEAGIDSSAVERAALQLGQRSPESLLARIAGGPIRHRESIHLATPMSEKTSARLLSAVRAVAEVPGEGRADAGGFSWHAWDRGNRLSVTAHEDAQGTKVQVLVNRSSPMVLTAIFTLFALVLLISAAVESVDPPELLVFGALVTGLLAGARAFWKSSTRGARERTAALLAAVREAARIDDVKTD